MEQLFKTASKDSDVVGKAKVEHWPVEDKAVEAVREVTLVRRWSNFCHASKPRRDAIVVGLIISIPLYNIAGPECVNINKHFTLCICCLLLVILV